jgi:hypothetical protein
LHLPHRICCSLNFLLLPAFAPLFRPPLRFLQLCLFLQVGVAGFLRIVDLGGVTSSLAITGRGSGEKGEFGAGVSEITRSGDAVVSAVSVFAAGTEGVAGASVFAAATGVMTGALAATRSSRFGSILGEIVIIAPPANPSVIAANAVPTPAKNEVVLKAICVLQLSEGNTAGEPAFRTIARFFPNTSADLRWNEYGWP